MICLRKIAKSYSTGHEPVHVLRSIDLEIARGEYLVLTGKSGSGKSTLMHILGCLDSPTSGEYELNGKRVDSLSDQEKSFTRNRDIGFVFQGFHLISDATVLENVAHPLIYRNMANSQRKHLALQALAKVGLLDRARFLPSQLSGGQRQRVAIARAICTSPTLLLADEPTGNLDSESASQILNIFDRLHAEGNTIVLVTHDSDTARRAKRQIVLKDGSIE